MVKRPDRMTLSIPVELKRQARVKAFLAGKDLSKVVRELLTLWLEDKIELFESPQDGAQNE